ncbi:hypothetical protein M501DRAFT_930351 [Patellaria atrata CBS 101060]|uniref:Zn(2)-C6 fungal-type domain-containing protein n=1 Tax=Patellaria atrata CBS 101060 TaxID=1346257 RepID=A0A9P4SDZ2_9PEZI|nr:hypothetical protein M501DRAFT_930351 [Patellaria atrata CBS 101060]
MADAENKVDNASEVPVETSQQESVLLNGNASSSPQKRQKSRHRASVACASCRDRRIRCVVPPGETECTQCKRSGVQCVIKNDDERRRAYMCSLTDRVALLEGMLKERGAEPPPANHPPKTRTGLPRTDDRSPNRRTYKPQEENSTGNQSTHDNSSPGSQHEDFMDTDQMDKDSPSHRSDIMDSASSPSVLTPPQKDGMVSRLLSTRGHLSFDQLSGRLRYFGPTTNCHIHSELSTNTDGAREALEQTRRAEKIIRGLPLDTYEYLMDLFWQHYNCVMHVVHREAFNEDHESGRTQFYSGFLHICMLAVGYRFADKTRLDIQRLTLPGKESTLHREAKFMLDYELERPGGIPSVAALLMIGDLECQVGRDNSGWLYGGIAIRLAFDIGLHLDCRSSGLPQREVDIRHMTLWACVIYDKYWALFLGRPTSMKSSDIEIHSLANQFERLGTCRPAGVERSVETMIYEALLDVMELAGKITENIDPRSQSDDRNAYLRMAALDREFGNWYARLPEPLRWTPHNINNAPFSFFLLHQQYHCALILLHRPFAMYEEPATSETEEGNGHDNHFSALSRTVCTKHAIRVARIFWQHRQRFDTKQICIIGLQHAGTAATALVAALAFIKDSSDRNNNMQYLEVLSAALQDMACTYQPAERMSVVLTGVMNELGGSSSDSNRFPRPKGTLVPARRGSTIDDTEPYSFKRHQSSRPRSNTHKSARSTSMSTSMSMDLGLTGPRHHNTDSDLDRGADSFVMVTPRSEICSWPPTSTGMPLDPALPTPTSTLESQQPPRPWMSGDVNPNDVSHLASIHFPEMSHLADNEGASHGAGVLDFMNLGGDEWRDWQPDGSSVITDLDGFPPTGGLAFGGERFGSLLNA